MSTTVDIQYQYEPRLLSISVLSAWLVTCTVTTMVTSLLHELHVTRAALASKNLVVHMADSMHSYDEDDLITS